MKSTIIIPARWASKRFPGKPLAKIKKKELIHHVWDRAKLSKEADLCLVATDDKRIKKFCEDNNIRVTMTSTKHLTGTDRVYEVAKKINQEIPNSHILDQYTNPANPDAHYENTAQEILNEFDDSLKMVVAGVGTGGTITGLSKRLKEERQNINIIGVDPFGSILGGGDEVFPYHVEGIGYDFFPDVLDNNLIDEYIKLPDPESFQMARRLIKEEGLLIGGSSGGAVWAALQTAKRLDKGDKCLVILPDSIRNYLTKFADDEWMEEMKKYPHRDNHMD